MECDYTHAESLSWSKPGEHGINGPRNVLTHALKVPIGQNEVGIELATDGMESHTN
jgi:hypothetical protein